MNDSKNGRDLGMQRDISRRDFLNGSVVTAASLLLAREPGLSADLHSENPATPGYYPPALTGMRGNHDGSFPTAHSLRDHQF